jgi:hypothetical protein
VSLTFGGSRSTALAAGADIYSDPVAFPVTVANNLLISVYLPGPVTKAPTRAGRTTTQRT